MLHSTENSHPISTKRSMDVEAYMIYNDGENEEQIMNTKAWNSCGTGSFQCVLGTWYSNQMATHPLRTKSITTGLLRGVGDILAQLIEIHTSLGTESSQSFEKLRLLAMMIDGTCFTGPMLHFMFDFYEYLCPINCNHDSTDSVIAADFNIECTDSKVDSEYDDRKKFMNAFLHVLFDQIVMAFFDVGSMMIVTCIVEGHGGQLMHELRYDYFPAVRASWMASLVLAPILVVAFRYLPVSWRTIAVNVQDVFWVVFMSYVTHRNRDSNQGWESNND